MVDQGYFKTSKSDKQLRKTAIGSDFLKEFRGSRRFLS
jgi:hypothetical protein